MTQETQETQEIQEAIAAVLDQAPAQGLGALPVQQDPVVPPAGGPPAPDAPKTAAKKRKQKKKIKRIIALAVVLALLAAGGYAVWYFILRNTVEQGQLLEDEVHIGTIQSKVEGSGNARAGENAVITLSASGTVQEVYVSANDVINEGDPLYSIYSPAAQKAVQDAEDAVEQAREAIPNAQDAVVDAQNRVQDAQDAVQEAQDGVKEAQDRVKEAQDAVKEAEDGVKEAQDAVKEAEDGVKEAQEGVQDAQDELAKRQKELGELQADAEGVTITAPFAGRLISVEEIKPGDELGADGAVATLANDSVMKLTLYFSYAYENSVRAGQNVDVSVPSMMLSCPGTVTAVNKIRKITPEGAILFEAEIAVPNPGALTKDLEATGSMTAADGSKILPYENGKLDYSETHKITAKVAGKVVKVDMRVDAAVAAGQVLVLQSSENVDELIEAKQKEIKQAQKAVVQAEKGVETAKKGVEAAKKSVETAQKGVESAQKGVESAQKGVETAQKAVITAQRGVTAAQKDVEKAIKDVEKAQRAVPEAEEALEKARKDLEDLNAVAPISGTVTSCTITPGQEVKGGDTVITIADTTNMVVEIKVDDQNIGFVTPGLMVELTNYGEGMWTGTVTKIDMNPSQDDMGSGVTKYPVTLTVDNFDGTLITGMWLQYSFVASQSEDCLVVQNQAVKSTVDEEGNDITVVFLKADSRPDNAVTMPEQSPDSPKKYPTEDEGYYAVPVAIGLSDTYNVEIRSGLNEGDTVFTNYLSASGDSWGMYG